MSLLTPTNRPRLVPELPLPPYSYVPGRWPHPHSDPAGHWFGKPIERSAPLDPDHWEQSRAYRYGIDLFNHGYYWEAHEVWEGLWHAAGRRGPVADFLKGLIKLAAAGVKVREGKPHGAVHHATRAAELFGQLAQQRGGPGDRFLGLSLHELINYTDAIGRAAFSCQSDPVAEVKRVFDFILQPVSGGEGP